MLAVSGWQLADSGWQSAVIVKSIHSGHEIQIPVAAASTASTNTNWQLTTGKRRQTRVDELARNAHSSKG